MTKNDPHLCVDGSDRATVDFLSHGVAVEISVKDGVFSVSVSASHGEEASSWDERFVAWDLPSRPCPRAGQRRRANVPRDP